MSIIKKTKLYKYIPCSNREQLKRVVDAISNFRVYLSDGSNFNDPFDLLVRNKYYNTQEKISNLHILCLTNSNKNALMWAHYACSHRGICFTVEVPSDLVYPVCYSGKTVDINENIDRIIENSQKSCKRNLQKDYRDLSFEKKAALIKSQKWNYEKEYRLLFDNSKGLIVENGKWYLSAKITAVYLGVNFDINQNKKIINLCKEKKITIKKMTLERNKYALKPIDYK